MRSGLAALEPYLTLDWNDAQWQTPDAAYTSLLSQLKKARRRTLLGYWGNDRHIHH
ncbi:hypothetical protein OG612_06365 [Streptomyces sp. NBC_01527]|uniref:hypothetical protein n=1 Tax=Streptomyces sp. NBC_01527 TaxID=2903894 RepID=UPI00386737DC